MIRLSLILLLLVGCVDLPDEGTLKRQETSVTITYNHPSTHDIELTRYNKSTRTEGHHICVDKQKFKK